MRGEDAAFNKNTKRRTGGPWEGKTQASTRTIYGKSRSMGGEDKAFNMNTKRRTGGQWEG
jgi:hypothetical protein